MGEGRRWWLWMALPSVVLVALTAAYPVTYAIVISFREHVLTRPELDAWVGLGNYVRAIHDPVFWTAIANTAIWGAQTMAVELTLAVVGAFALDRGLPGSRLFAGAIFLPYFLPSIVSAHTWILLLDDQVGLVNVILRGVGVHPPLWLADPRQAMITASLVEAWRSFPFLMFVFLVALRTVPREVLEAAEVDGAGPRSRVLHVVLPLIAPIVCIGILIRLVALLNTMDVVLVLTGGGPAYGTETLSLYAYQTASQSFDFGYSGALSMILLSMVVAVVLPLGWLVASRRAGA